MQPVGRRFPPFSNGNANGVKQLDTTCEIAFIYNGF
jgi:hypothetical protein